jgi:hypothetical protein
MERGGYLVGHDDGGEAKKSQKIAEKSKKHGSWGLGRVYGRQIHDDDRSM